MAARGAARADHLARGRSTRSIARTVGTMPRTALHGGGNKMGDAGLTVQVHYAFTGMKGDRSRVLIVASHLERRCSLSG